MVCGLSRQANQGIGIVARGPNSVAGLGRMEWKTLRSVRHLPLPMSRMRVAPQECVCLKLRSVPMPRTVRYPCPVTPMPRHAHAPSRPCPVTPRHRHAHAPSRPCPVTPMPRHAHAPSRPGTVTPRHRHAQAPSRPGTVWSSCSRFRGAAARSLCGNISGCQEGTQEETWRDHLGGAFFCQP
jgi:hypothetical protein